MLVAIEKWFTQAQFPDGRFVALGTPEFVAYVAIKVLVFAVRFTITVCCPVVVPIGDHSL